MVKQVLVRLIAVFALKFDKKTNTYVSQDGKYRIVWPIHDTDAQIAYDLRTGAIDFAAIGSNDSDMLFYPSNCPNDLLFYPAPGATGLTGVLYNFTLNTVGSIFCSPLLPEFVKANLESTCAEYGALGLKWLWPPMKRLAFGVLSGCDYFRISNVGGATAAAMINDAWNDEECAHQNFLAVNDTVVDLLAGPSDSAGLPHRYVLKFGSPTFLVAMYSWLFQLVLDKDGQAVTCYEIPSEVRECPCWKNECDVLKKDAFAELRVLDTWSETFYHCNCGPTCIPMEGESTPPPLVRTFPTAAYKNIDLSADELDVSALCILLIPTIIDWLKRVHVEEEFPGAIFSKGWSRAMDSPTTIKSIKLHRPKHDIIVNMMFLFFINFYKQPDNRP